MRDCSEFDRWVSDNNISQSFELNNGRLPRERCLSATTNPVAMASPATKHF